MRAVPRNIAEHRALALASEGTPADLCRMVLQRLAKSEDPAIAERANRLIEGGK